MPGSVQVPKNRTHEQKNLITGPGTAGKSDSVLEPEPEPPKALGLLSNKKKPQRVSSQKKTIYIKGIVPNNTNANSCVTLNIRICIDDRVKTENMSLIQTKPDPKLEEILNQL